MKRFIIAMVLIGLSTSFTFSAPGEESSSPLMCEPSEDFISPTEHLRAISLDLTGKIPSLSDLQEVEAEGVVSDSRVQAMLDSPGFEVQTIRFHHKLMWPYVRNNINLYMGIQLERDWNGVNAYYRSDSPHWDRFLRTSPYNPNLNPGGCGDWPEPDPNNIQPIDQGGGIVKEGWVCVKPYFFFQGIDDPQVGSMGDCPVGEVKVCAYDAQAHLISPVSGALCSEANGQDKGCGCGPELRYCSSFGYFEQTALQSLNEQIRWMVANDRPYYELLTDAPPFVDGQMAHYYRHISPNPPFAKELVPDLDPIADAGNWVAVSVGTHASGVLTHPVFLTRFQTRRGRTDRYYNSFLCQPFQVPAGGIPPSTDEEMMEPDLQKRPGCKYCHTTIEPVGAYWGHWQEFGISYLNPVDFPDFDPDCYTCATLNNCDNRCRRNYIVSAPTGQELPYLGMLQAYLFLAEEDIDNILTGPRLLVHRTLLDGRLPACVTRNVAVWLLGRQILPDEEEWLLQIQQGFMASNYDFKGLVHSIVMSDFYRRVR